MCWGFLMHFAYCNVSQDNKHMRDSWINNLAGVYKRLQLSKVFQLNFKPSKCWFAYWIDFLLSVMSRFHICSAALIISRTYSAEVLMRRKMSDPVELQCSLTCGDCVISNCANKQIAQVIIWYTQVITQEYCLLVVTSAFSALSLQAFPSTVPQS